MASFRSKQKNQKGIAFIPFLIIIAAILMLATPIFKNFSSKTSQVPSPSSESSPTPISTPSLTPKPISKKTPSPKPTPSSSATINTSQTLPPTVFKTPIPTPDFNKNATVTIISPNGGETFNIGDTIHITWTTTGPLTNFMIDYSTGLYSLSSIDQVFYGNGSFDWKISLGAGSETQFKIRAGGVNLNEQFVSDYSNNYFTINR